MEDAQQACNAAKKGYKSKSYLIRVEDHFCEIIRSIKVRNIEIYLTLILTLHKYPEMRERLYYKIFHLEFQQDLGNQLMKIMKR